MFEGGEAATGGKAQVTGVGDEHRKSPGKRIVLIFARKQYQSEK